MAMLAFSAASLALAMAERTHFSILFAARLFVNCRIAKASLTFLPRIISTTRRAFIADPRKYFALALASISRSAQVPNSKSHVPSHIPEVMLLTWDFGIG